MTSEWQPGTIGDVCTKVYSGGTPTSTNAAYYGGNIPWLRTKEVNYGKIFATEQYITDLGLKESSAKLVPINSIIVAMYGNGDTAGRVAINKIPLTTNQACCNLVVDPAKADYRFVYYYLKGKYRELVDLKNGGAQQNLNGQLIKAFPIVFPLLSEQTAIAEILEGLDNRITLLRETNVTLESIAQTLFKSWFVDFDPVRAKMEGRIPEGMDEATAALFPDGLEESALGVVPSGWSRIPFGHLLCHTIGGDWGSDVPDEKNDTRVAIIRGTDIPDLQSGANSRVPVRYTSGKKLKTRKLEDGDIVLEVSGGSKDQPTGRALYLTEGLLGQFDCPVEPASFCRLLRPSNKDIGVVLGQHLTYIYSQGKTWEYQNQSTGIANFQTTHFLEAELVVVPPNDLLDVFVGMVRPLIERTHLTQIQELSNLRDTLLPRLISGQLRLTDVENQIEAIAA